jgi:NADH:ubiquinone oxidoreductase subunit K
VFAVFVITVAAAEAATGLAILIALYRISRVVNADEASALKW